MTEQQSSRGASRRAEPVPPPPAAEPPPDSTAAPDVPPTDKPQSDLERRIADLELQLAQSRAMTPLGTTPNHGAGVGESTAETWSMFDQGLAYAGEHPDQQDQDE